MADPAVFHLSRPAEWAASQRAGQVAPPSLAAEGFIHCSTGAQLVGTIERHFAGVDELRILELDPATTAADLRWEESRPGEAYPHLYRPLAVSEVTRVLPWQRAQDGSVAPPPDL